MSYKEKPQLKLYKYENNSFVLQAIIDDYQECSFEDNLFEAGQFSITINFNIPNSQLFQRGLFIRFGNSWKFGEITRIQDQIGEDGKGSQYRIITGFDARYILKRRVIKNMNSNGLWIMTGKGEIVLRNLINDQAGTNAEEKRRLPIVNTIPTSENAIGKEYSASEQFSNLYEVCKTIAIQSEIGWRLEFDGTNLNLVCFEGTDRTQTVQFSTAFDSLANGEFVDSSESFSNAIYVGGKGQNDDRDIYEGESAIEGDSPSGLDRFESWDNQSSMTTESEYENEALSMLSQYGQILTMSGNGLAKCPYEYEKEYFTGDKIKIAFSGKSANTQILSVTEHWAFGAYEINFSFGKPLPDLNAQLQLMLRKIQTASNKTNSKDSVRWYTIPTDTTMPASDVTYNTIGFIGNVGSGATFTLYRDSSGTGSKTYHVYFKQLGGSGKLTLTTGVSGATNLVMNPGTYVAIIYVDENGNITSQGMTATGLIESGNNQPVESGAVADEISNLTEIASSLPTDSVLHYSFDEVPDYPDGNADVRLLDNNTYDIQNKTQKFVDNGGSVFSSDNGNLQIAVATAQTNGGAYIPNTYIQNKVIKMQISITTLSGDVTVRNGIGTTVLTINKTGSFEVTMYGNALTTSDNGLLIISDSTFTAVIKTIYIGNGSYSTPIIDNANGEYQTTQTKGFVAQNGVSGKGIYFPNILSGETRFKLPAYNTSKSMTISLWAKFENSSNVTGALGLVANSYFRTALGLAKIYKASVGVRITAIARTPNKEVTVTSGVNEGQWNHIVAVFANDHRIYLYINGVYINRSSVMDSAYQYTETNWILNKNSTFYGPLLSGNNAQQTIDDLLIFDRALSEKEVQALYQNKANTPKYYDLSDYKLKEVKENAQAQTLATPITIGGQSYTTVESALQALAGLV